jgi:hypothetical protein
MSDRAADGVSVGASEGVAVGAGVAAAVGVALGVGEAVGEAAEEPQLSRINAATASIMSRFVPAISHPSALTGVRVVSSRCYLAERTGAISDRRRPGSTAAVGAERR